MKNNDRVLARAQARDLTENEIRSVTGGTVRTLSVCTIPSPSALADGDPGEC